MGRRHLFERAGYRGMRELADQDIGWDEALAIAILQRAAVDGMRVLSIFFEPEKS